MPPGRLTTRFDLIRHAPTRWNMEKRIQGQADSPLTAAGIVRARNWGNQLAEYPWDQILTSDSGRAVHTARLIDESLKIGLTLEPGLREQDWGQWTGLPVKDLENDAAKQLQGAATGWHFRPPNGEARTEVLDRAVGALERTALHRPGSRILIVAHQGIIKCLTYGLLGRRFTADEPPVLKVDHLHRLIHDHDGLKIDRLNALALVP